MKTVVAYTIGSFWYCLSCVEQLGQDEELAPHHASNLFEDTSYYCDSCGAVIREAS